MEDTLVYEENMFEWRPSKRGAALEQIILLLLALCPVLQHYQGFVLEVSSEVMLLLSPYVLIKLIRKRKLVYKAVLPLLSYAVYISFIHGLNVFTLGREMLLVLYYIAMINGCLDVRRYFCCAKAVALCLSCCIFAQYISYYGFQKHIQFVPTNLFTESSQQWIGLAETGRIAVTGKAIAFYRPSGFLLEPSHVSLYCIPVLCILLLRKNMSYLLFLQAIIISLGVIMSTSGIGIFFVAGVWLLYLVRYYGLRAGRRRKLGALNKTAVVLLVVLMFLAIILYFSVDFLQSAINRVFINSEGGITAIGGRTSTGIRLLGMMSGAGYLVGEGTSLDISNWNVSGFFYVTFQYGLIGCLLLNLFYIESLFKVKNGYFWLSVLVMALSPFTVHTFAAFYRMYYVCCIMGGYSRGAAAEMVPKLYYPELEQGPLTKLRT